MVLQQKKVCRYEGASPSFTIAGDGPPSTNCLPAIYLCASGNRISPGHPRNCIDNIRNNVILTKMDVSAVTDNTNQPNTPKVSVCIPTFDRKEYLKETLDSILAQTYKNYEIIIVDDGSTDGTADMITSLGYPITYHWQQNTGDAAARNKLIELAKGDYISFIDSDDLLVPDAVEKMVEAIQAQPDEAVVYGSYYRIDEAGKVYGKCKRKLRSGHITKYLFQTILIHSCGSMFPRKMLKTASPFDDSLKVCSDYDLWLRLSAEYRFIALPEPTFKRRRHLSNLSSYSFENCFTEFQVLKRFYYEKGGKELVPEKIAKKAFGKQARRAGRCALREGLHDQACQLLSQSFRQYPNPKSLISWTRALMSLLHNDF